MRFFIPIFITIILCFIIILPYVYIQRRKSAKIEKKIIKAKENGLYEPASLHPKIDPDKCIGSGACIAACPEKEIIGVVNGKGCLVNAARCVGHGACAQACPVGAITLVFGTETRGVDIPYVTPRFETNVKGMFIAGELGGMGLIKNAMKQGKEAVDYIGEDLRTLNKNTDGVYDLIIVGAGPAGISGGLRAQELKLKYTVIDQDDIGGTVLHYPKKKIVMTSPVHISMFGKFKKREIIKEELLDFWKKIIAERGLELKSEEGVTSIQGSDKSFTVITNKTRYSTRKILLAIGRRGTPRKPGVKGENFPKVAYRMLDPDQHKREDILIVGGGDSAVEAALAISEQGDNRISISYRNSSFSRIKDKNRDRLKLAVQAGKVKTITSSNVKEILEKSVVIERQYEQFTIPNDYIYILIGGELPKKFLDKIGINIKKKFGTV